jgi:hypothetical protein
MEIFGALVGWTHQDHDERIILCVESMQADSLARNEPDLCHFLMTKQQALILGHHLLKISGEPIAPPRASWLRRIVRRIGPLAEAA